MPFPALHVMDREHPRLLRPSAPYPGDMGGAHERRIRIEERTQTEERKGHGSVRAVGPERTIATDREGGKPQAEKRGKERIEKEEEEEERGTRMGKGSSHGGAKEEEEEEEEEGKLRERDRRGKFGFSSLFILSLYPRPPPFRFSFFETRTD